MPTYTYRCKCGSVFDAIVPIRERNKPQKCPDCGGKGRRDEQSEFASAGKFNELMVDRPRWSEAMGVNPEQIPQAMKMFPDSVYHPKTGALLIRNRQHKLKEMKRRGYAEFDGCSGSWRRQPYVKAREERKRYG